MKPTRRVLLVALFAFPTALALYVQPLFRPLLLMDDYQIFVPARTWERTCAALWVPTNEHTMPLGRLTTWALVNAAGSMTALPLVGRLQGLAALFLGMGLIYALIRREFGEPFYALLALYFFGVTAVYEQVVTWFAASFSLLTADTILLALLAAQRWRQTGRFVWLLLCLVGVFCAPGWFASGVLAGPICCAYLFSWQGWKRRGTGAGAWLPFSPIALLPMLGTAAFLAVSLPLTAQHIQHLEHYQGKTATESFHPVIGLLYTGRSIVENLVLGVAGICGLSLPWSVNYLLLLGIIALGVWWWWRASDHRLLQVGLVCILSNYWLVYSARAEWGYDEAHMNYPTWDRYHLLPQLGLTLFVVGGLPAWRGRWFDLEPTQGLSTRQLRGFLGLGAVLLLVHLPRIIAAHGFNLDPAEQIQVLQQIDDVDELCQRHHISAETARTALVLPEGMFLFTAVPEAGLPPWAGFVLNYRTARPPYLELPWRMNEQNGWELLRGSDDPRPVSIEEAHRLLSPNGR